MRGVGAIGGLIVGVGAKSVVDIVLPFNSSIDRARLRRQADQFLELADIAPEFTRRQMEPRPSRMSTRVTPAEPYADPQDGT